MTINAYDGGAISSGVQRNPNMNLDQKPLKFGVEAKLQPWGHNIREGFEWLEGPRPEWWWTGKKPVFGECPGVTEQGYITSLPLPHLKAGGFTRQDVINYFDNSWTITEVLFSSLQTQESFYRPPYHQLRHPFAFYMLHPAVFYINKYRLAGLINEPINPHFEALFETGVDEMSWDDMSKNNESWPSVKESVEYRSIAYQRILEVLKNHPSLEGKESVTLRDPAWAVFMCFEHERIHIETSSVLMRELPLSLLRRPENFPPLHASAPSDATPFVEFKNEFITIPGGVANLGRAQNVDSFGWDNEFGETKLRINTFQAEKYLCTNAQFWKFVSSGAYIDERYWTPEGWSWRSFRNAKWPTFWVPDGPQGLHKYALRCIFEIIPMPWDWPAVVNYHEAKAYCNWYSEQINKPCRVCTEAEHWLMRDSSCTDENSGPFRDPVLARQGKQTELKSNLNLSYGSESSVTSFPPASTGIYDAMGNVWVWCEDWFSPLDGFRVHPLYDDFSTPCFDNKHSMILGGSFISTGNEASIWARFHFRSHFFQHAGFRVVCGEGGPTARPITTDQKKRREALENESTSSNPYETMKYLSEYLHLHFSSKEDVIPYDFAPKDAAQFPKRTAIISADIAKKLGTSTTRALDLGCAVGGASFELAKTFSSVVGIDLSESFVNTANILKEKGEMEYFRKDEGDLSTKLTAKVDSEIDRSRTSFRVGDACCLPPDLGDFDLVLTANLLCRLASPKSCLGRMGGLKGIVRPGGLLVNFSPFTWMDDFTNKGAWLGGYYDENGNPVYSRQGLQDALGPEFTLVEEQDVPMLIREHARKYQYIVPHLSVWRRASRKSP